MKNKSRTPNPNLWAVKYSVDGVPHSPLWICAATIAAASNKARRHLRKQGYRSVFIRSVKSRGTIDAF